MNFERRILIVDDEALIAEHLKDILSSYGYSNFQIECCKEDALKAIETFAPELILLDIRMEGELDGIEIGSLLNLKFKIPFIYITAHSDLNMLKLASQNGPQGYLTKPFKKIDVLAIVEMAFKYSTKPPNYLTVRDGFNVVKIKIDEIHYIQSDGNYISIYSDENRYYVRNSLDSILNLLPINQFKRVHRSFIINIKRIKSVQTNFVVIEENEIPVARNFIKEIRDML